VAYFSAIRANIISAASRCLFSRQY